VNGDAALNAAPPFRRRTPSTFRSIVMTPLFWGVVWPMSKILSRC